MLTRETRTSQNAVLGWAVIIEMIGAFLIIGGLLSLWPSSSNDTLRLRDVGKTSRMIQ
jgi:hypothetical protein